MENANECEFWSDVVGFVLTTFSSLLVIVVVYYADKYRKRRNIKNTIKLFLRDTIIPSAEKIKLEVPISKEAVVEFYTHKNPVIGMYPTFNATVLESLSITEVQDLLEEHFVLFINVIGRLNNLQNRIPYPLLASFSDMVNEHMVTEHPSKKETYSSYEDHFQRCKQMIHLTNRCCDQLDNMEVIIDHLITESNEILKVLK